LAPPSRIDLPAGTRIWLKLDSVIPDSEGNFQFKALLLLPVTSSGQVLIDKGAQVFGHGKIVKGQASLQITEIASEGRDYRPDSSASRVPSESASGKTVSFQSGQVLEMWLVSRAAFHAESGATGPQK